MHALTVKSVGFKQALRDTIDAGPLPPKAVADLMDVSYGQLMAYADVSQDVHIPSHRIARLLGICPDLSLLTYLASLQGAAVVSLPKPGSGEVLVLERRRA